jgi:hypothetical protein
LTIGKGAKKSNENREGKAQPNRMDCRGRKKVLICCGSNTYTNRRNRRDLEKNPVLLLFL